MGTTEISNALCSTFCDVAIKLWRICSIVMLEMNNSISDTRRKNQLIPKIKSTLNVVHFSSHNLCSVCNLLNETTDSVLECVTSIKHTSYF